MTKRLVLLALIATAITLFFAFDLGRYVSLPYLQEQRGALIELRITGHDGARLVA